MAQAGTQRTADIFDVIRDLVGTLVAISFFAPTNKTAPKPYLRTIQILTIFMVVFAVFPFVKAFSDEFLARNHFPVLSDFETPFEIDRWTGDAKLSIDDAVHFNGGSSLKVALNTSKYSGAILKYFPGNWSNYKYLRLNIFNPRKEPLKIICRIHDRRHTDGNQAYDDRFNKNYVLNDGWNLIEIPLKEVVNAPKDRKLNLKEVQEIGIFVYRLPRPWVIYIDNVSLTNNAVIN